MTEQRQTQAEKQARQQGYLDGYSKRAARSKDSVYQQAWRRGLEARKADLLNHLVRLIADHEPLRRECELCAEILRRIRLIRGARRVTPDPSTPERPWRYTR